MLHSISGLIITLLCDLGIFLCLPKPLYFPISRKKIELDLHSLNSMLCN